MAATLSQDESVHIVAYEENLKQHIEDTLEKNNADMNQIDFVIAPSDDVWIRDTGPIFVKDEKGQLAIMNFSFDGWGKRCPTPSLMPLIWSWKAARWRSARMEH